MIDVGNNRGLPTLIATRAEIPSFQAAVSALVTQAKRTTLPRPWVRTLTILTTKPNELLAPLDDRMPLILAPTDYDLWLDVTHDHPEAALHDWAEVTCQPGGRFAARLTSEQQWPLGKILRMDTNIATTLHRPVDPAELESIRRAQFRAFPPGLPEQPIFYPVLTEAYAVKIARDWNVMAYGAGHVVRFAVLTSFLTRYSVQQASGSAHLESRVLRLSGRAPLRTRAY